MQEYDFYKSMSLTMLIENICGLYNVREDPVCEILLQKVRRLLRNDV